MSGNELWQELSRALDERAATLEKILKEFIVDVTSSNLQDLLAKNKVVFLYFTAEWCGPCVNFFKTYKEVAVENISPGVVYGKVDVDAAYSVADKYKVRHIPSILIIVDGKVMDTVVGSVSRQELERKVKAYVALARGQQVNDVSGTRGQ
ncbi:MAG: thioredoxin family protein [Acidilobus sp.]